MNAGAWKQMTAGVVVGLTAAGAAIDTRAEEKAAGGVPLKIELPKPIFVSTPPQSEPVPNLETPRAGPRPLILVPEGIVNLARNKPVASSDKDPISGFLDMITDGDKSAQMGSEVELSPGLQWVQIDLGEPSPIHAIVVWHFHFEPRVYHDVIVQISDDPAFAKEVHTVFNNDHDNSSGLGAGKDRAYVETHEGRLIQVKGIPGRHVRLYSNGNTTNARNHYIEVEVYGVPPKSGDVEPPPGEEKE